jgi:hypothetical protein
MLVHYVANVPGPAMQHNRADGLRRRIVATYGVITRLV